MTKSEGTEINENINDLMMDCFWTKDNTVEGIIRKNIIDKNRSALIEKENQEASSGRKIKIIKIRFFCFFIIIYQTFSTFFPSKILISGNKIRY